MEPRRSIPSRGSIGTAEGSAHCLPFLTGTVSVGGGATLQRRAHSLCRHIACDYLQRHCGEAVIPASRSSMKRGWTASQSCSTMNSLLAIRS